MISPQLTEDDLFSASQVCQRWRSILISSASTWTRISCNNRPRVTACLERCGSLPIQLRLQPPFPGEALEEVLLHGNKVFSSNLSHDVNQTSKLQQLFAYSRPSVERLLLHSSDYGRVEPGEGEVPEIWQGFPLLRELFVKLHFVPIDRLIVPNLVHLALESSGWRQNTTCQLILDMLRGCPLLETLLLNSSDPISPATIQGQDPVNLSYLRSIEVGADEIDSGLIALLDFPPDIKAGFRLSHPDGLCGEEPGSALAAMQHVLRKVNVRCITLAAHLRYQLFLLRFEGLRGSLEITTGYSPGYPHLKDFLFGPGGVLFSHSPHIENVTEIHIVECPFDTNQGLDHVKAAMPNVDTITFFQRYGSYPFGPLTAGDTSSLLFPRLERVMVLGSESRLEEMARNRRDLGAPLKTLVLGRDPGFNYDRLEDYTTLEGLVGDLRVERPVEIVQWGAGKDFVDVWFAAGAPRVVSLNKA